MRSKIVTDGLIAITGQVHTVALGKDSFQESDIIGITSPITKNNYLVRSIYELPKIIKEAYFLSKHGRPGPVLIDIPKNIQEESISFEIFTSLLNEDLDEIKKYKNSFSSKDLEEFKKILTLSKKPVLVVGGGVLTSNATKIVKKFVKDFNLPVVSTLMGLGIFNSSYENYFGMIGMHGLKEANRLVDDCDLLISFGMRFDDRIVGDKKNFSPNSKKIHIDIDRAEVNKNILVDLPIISDIKTFLENFYQLNFYKTFDSWFSNYKNKKIKNEIQINNKILNQISVLEKLNEFIDENYIVVTDVGQHQMFTAQHLDIKVPYHFCTSGGAGTMGYELPAAICAQIANPNKKVIEIVGDLGKIEGFLKLIQNFNILEIARIGVVGMARGLEI